MKVSLVLLATFTLISCSGCSDEVADIINSEPTVNTDTGDEESSIQLSLIDTYDQTRNGARLILNYDVSTHSFKGTVENVTNRILTSVRVEVHQDNGIELGPTTPVNMSPGAVVNIELKAEGIFARWVAHPEVGTGGGEGGK